eukprot:TRINITY_DN39471_c0_g1_i1.p2 TRINITY_DN39471_c0_g1~~TRINITY_DN39471_c0_g1_i1.p2  ORF type:complete len:308 (+),score=55.39 TRINITY_DN39471_c0_g1_i1:70-993(+)
MKYIVAVLAVFAVLAVTAMAANQFMDEPILNDAIIEEVNRHGSWRAHRSPRFEGMTRREARKYLGAQLDLPSYVTPATPLVLHGVNVPDSFDWRQENGACIGAIRNQEQCGSCWAFGAVEALSDRFCIASKGATKVILSPQNLVSCDSGNYGCQGGFLPVAWQYMTNSGVVADSCFPYTSGSGTAPPCSQICNNGQRYYVEAGSIVQPKTVQTIQTLIQTSGPVEAAFSVYADFFSYSSGVYTHKTGGLEGGHAIKILGWGVDAGVPYWIVANSWGTTWGLSGFFWIKRGTNECGIESNVIAGTPKL